MKTLTMPALESPLPFVDVSVESGPSALPTPPMVADSATRIVSANAGVGDERAVAGVAEPGGLAVGRGPHAVMTSAIAAISASVAGASLEMGTADGRAAEKRSRTGSAAARRLQDEPLRKRKPVGQIEVDRSVNVLQSGGCCVEPSLEPGEIGRLFLGKTLLVLAEQVGARLQVVRSLDPAEEHVHARIREPTEVRAVGLRRTRALRAIQ